jgi:hypothetical protein
MDMVLQALPLPVLLALPGSGRAAPVSACLIALAASLPGIAVSLSADLPLPRFLAGETPRAAFLGVPPVATLSGGLGMLSLWLAPWGGLSCPRRSPCCVPWRKPDR